MDPLSIIASVITLGEAVRRIVQLAAKIRSNLKFTQGLDSLISNVELLSHALDTASSCLPFMHPESASRLVPIISESQYILLQIENLVRECEDDIQKSSGNFNLRVRICWVKRAAKVQKLKERLSHILFGVQFFFAIYQG